MPNSPDVLTEIRDLIGAHARPGMTTAIDGLQLSKVTTGPESPDYSLTEPLLVVMAQGGKRLLLGDQVHEYRSGQYLLVTANLPVTGHFFDTSAAKPALGMGLVLRRAAIADLVLQDPRWSRGTPRATAMATGDAPPDLLDAVLRMLRLLDHPADAPVLAPLVEREILWRVLTGPHGHTLRQIGLADGDLAHVSRAIGWMRQNYAEPMRIEDLARTCGMSASAFHRSFRAVTAMSPLQFQKRIRLQEARSHVVSQPGDIAAVGHLVGYDSPSQFSREYRRLFGAPPGLDARRLRETGAAMTTGSVM
ncbi:MAG: AraC family transcriptional regulator N-terminal domain-containing protein [Mycobacterium sp.]